MVSLNNPKWMSNIQIKDKIKSIYEVNDVCMTYKNLFTVCQYFFIITAQAYFCPHVNIAVGRHFQHPRRIENKNIILPV